MEEKVVQHVNDGICPLCDADASTGMSHWDSCFLAGQRPEFSDKLGWYTKVPTHTHTGEVGEPCSTCGHIE